MQTITYFEKEKMQESEKALAAQASACIFFSNSRFSRAIAGWRFGMCEWSVLSSLQHRPLDDAEVVVLEQHFIWSLLYTYHLHHLYLPPPPIEQQYCIAQRLQGAAEQAATMQRKNNNVLAASMSISQHMLNTQRRVWSN